MDDDFTENKLIQVSNEDIIKDTRFKIDILSYCDILEFNLFFIFSIMTISIITIFAFHHYGIGQNSIYFDKKSDFTLIDISPIDIIPHSSFFRIYLQVVQNKKNEIQEYLNIDITIIKNYLNGKKNKTHSNYIFNPTIYFDGKSSISSPITLTSSHDTSNYSIGFMLKTTFNKNDDKIIISWEFGSKSLMIFSLFLKFIFFIVSIIMFLLILWSHYYTDSFIMANNFKKSIALWISLFLNSFFYSYQINSFLYFIPSLITTAAFKIMSKMLIIYFISSVRKNRSSDYKGFEDHYVSFGYIFYSIFELISVFLTSISMFSYDQLSFELFGMKFEFYFNILFILFIFYEYVQSKSLIESQDKHILIAYFSLSLIFIMENVVVQYFIAIKNIYFCQQAANNINYTSSCIFVILLFCYNWPIDENYEIYYQQDFDMDDEPLQ